MASASAPSACHTRRALIITGLCFRERLGHNTKCAEECFNSILRACRFAFYFFGIADMIQGRLAIAFQPLIRQRQDTVDTGRHICWRHFERWREA